MTAKFQCPVCGEYVPFIGQLIPLNEELALHCMTCKDETAILKLTPIEPKQAHRERPNEPPRLGGTALKQEGKKWRG